MRSLPDLNSIGRSIRESPRRLLMLDYDGTLAPFRERREHAYPYEGIGALLTDISKDPRNTAVIISGRSIDDLLPLLNWSPRPEIWGSHGWERLLTDGRRMSEPLSPEVDLIMSDIRQTITARIDHRRVELKPFSIAVHWRGCTDADRVPLEHLATEIWSHLRNDPRFTLQSFDGGVELRIDGKNKGNAVLRLLEEHAGPLFAAYLGDDHTDEDAFRALRGRGLSVLVRQEARQSAADLHLVPPRELFAFLSLWLT